MIDNDIFDRPGLVRWIHEAATPLSIMRAELDMMPPGAQRERLERVYGRLAAVLAEMRAASPEFAAAWAALVNR